MTYNNIYSVSKQAYDMYYIPKLLDNNNSGMYGMIGLGTGLSNNVPLYALSEGSTCVV